MRAEMRAVIVLCLAGCVQGLGCLNEAGKKVDWWFAMKYPLQASESLGGIHYSIIDSDSLSWEDSKKTVEDATSVFGVTLDPITSSPKGDNSYMFYNDEHPDDQWTLDYGHSKGVLAWDSKSGFFLQHSIPKFPNFANKAYEYGKGQEKYGQHALCLSLELESIDAVAYALRFATPWIYSSNDKGAKLANATDLFNGKTFNNTVDSTYFKIDTTNSLKSLSLFGKTQQWGKDMVDSMIGPNLGVDTLWSQSWLNSGGPIGAYCPKAFTVLDISDLKYGSECDSWQTIYDHSKWAIGVGGLLSSSKWVCFNDNNRVASQYKRGGVSVCFLSSDLHSVLKEGVKLEGHCGKPGPGPPTPPAGKCCYYTDKTCATGDVCCRTGCKNPFQCSYDEEGCSGRYGQKHHCAWESSSSACIVQKSSLVKQKHGKIVEWTA